ncbi:MAG: hypothetical protein Q4A27_02515 [bacterium]|nr:hypothetical protein [bacterium]
MKTKIKTALLDYEDPILEQKIQVKVEEMSTGDVAVRVRLPEEKNFFRGVKFSEKVKLEKLKNGKWIKNLHAKFGAGAEEMFGVKEINEMSELENRDIRIIAAVEKMLTSKTSKKLQPKLKKARI